LSFGDNPIFEDNFFKDQKVYEDLFDKLSRMSKTISVYIDGSCRVHTTRKGSWGFLIVGHSEDSTSDKSLVILKEKVEIVENTTISVMEMTALKESLIYLLHHHPDDEITIYSDSQFVVNSYNEYLLNWINNGWKTSSGKEVSHKEIWMDIEEMSRYLPFRLEWVKAHDVNQYNNYIDSIVQLFSQSGEL